MMGENRLLSASSSLGVPTSLEGVAGFLGDLLLTLKVLVGEQVWSSGWEQRILLDNVFSALAFFFSSNFLTLTAI